MKLKVWRPFDCGERKHSQSKAIPSVYILRYFIRSVSGPNFQGKERGPGHGPEANKMINCRGYESGFDRVDATQSPSAGPGSSLSIKKSWS